MLIHCYPFPENNKCLELRLGLCNLEHKTSYDFTAETLSRKRVASTAERPCSLGRTLGVSCFYPGNLYWQGVCAWLLNFSCVPGPNCDRQNIKSNSQCGSVFDQTLEALCSVLRSNVEPRRWHQKHNIQAR